MCLLMVKQLLLTQETSFWSSAIQLDKQDSGRNMHDIDSKLFEAGFFPHRNALSCKNAVNVQKN